MEMSKELQTAILEYLKDLKGTSLPESFETDIVGIAGDSLTAYQALDFLIEEGLVHGRVFWRNEAFMYSKIEISSSGLKSIAEERIGAQQSMSITLSPETMDFLRLLVCQSDLSAKDKSGFLAALRKIPSVALAEGVKQIVAAGIRHLQALSTQG